MQRSPFILAIWKRRSCISARAVRRCTKVFKKINLHPADAPREPHAARPTPGSADLCFIVDEHIEAMVERLGQEGIKIVEGPVRRTGAEGPILSIYVRDPDGNLTS